MGRFAETAFHQDLFSVQLFEEEEVQDNLEHHDLDQLPLVFLNIGRRPCLMVPKYIEKECIFIANKIHFLAKRIGYFLGMKHFQEEGAWRICRT